MKNIKSLKYNRVFMSIFSWGVILWRKIRAPFTADSARNRDVVFRGISDVVVSDLLVRPKNIDGEFYLSPRSHLFRTILFSGSYEPNVVGLFEKYLSADRDVIDVGANVGFYSVLSAKRMKAGRVVALEPVKSAYERLLKNIKRNNVDEIVTAIQCFVSSDKGFSTIHSVPGMEEYSSASAVNVATHSLGDLSVSEQVECITIDEIIRERGLSPGLIKVDVEGAEFNVLRGAKECLKSISPTLIVECSDNLLKGMGSSSAELISFVEEYGYRVLNPYTEEEVSLRNGIEDNLVFVKPRSLRE